MSTESTDQDKALAEERVKKAVHRIAKALNMLEVTKLELEWSCKSQDWNDEVIVQIQEAAEKLGYSLATLTRWFDPDETFKEDEQ